METLVGAIGDRQGGRGHAISHGHQPGEYISIRFPATTPPNLYHIMANVAGVQKDIGRFSVPKGGFVGSFPVLVSATGPFTVADDKSGLLLPGDIALFTSSGPGPDLTYDPVTETILGPVGTRIRT